MFPSVLRRALLTVGASLLALSAARTAEIPDAAWCIETKQDPSGIPTSKLDLIIHGRQVVPVQSGEIRGDYRVIPRQDFARHKVPADALCACQSHVVNDGVYYYVKAAGKDTFALYRQDEDADGLTGFKKIRTISITTTRRTSVHTSPEFSGSPY